MYANSWENVVAQVALWYAPIVICYLAWPLLAKRRAYVVTAAVLFLTPVFVDYSFVEGWPAYFDYVDWLRPTAPLAVSIPEQIARFPENLPVILYMGLPLGALVGIGAWLLARRFVRPGAGSLLLVGAAPQSFLIEMSSRTSHSGLRSLLIGLRTALLALRNLLLLLLATAGYIHLWFIPLKILADSY